MAKKELNLLQFTAGGAAEPSATSTEIMRREFVHADFGGELLDDVPDELFRYSFAPALPAVLTRRKTLPDSISAAFVHSSIGVDPIWDGDGLNVTSLSLESTIAQCSSRCAGGRKSARRAHDDGGRTPAGGQAAPDHVSA